MSDRGDAVQIRADRSTRAYIAVLDLPFNRLPEVLDAASARARSDVRSRPGFVSASWLVRHPDDHSHGRIVEYVQWSTADPLGDDATDQDETRHLRLAQDPTVNEEFEQYRLTGVVSADHSGSLVLGPDAPGVFLVILMTPSGMGVDRFAALNEAHTREFISGYDGFGGAAFHVGARGHRIAEVAQWRSRAAFEQAAADPDFASHITEVGGSSSGTDFALYDVADTITRR